ncbi:helix-turn-helix domain-containing protein [Actinophytocola oryzae]|uniref:Helix-turn-helix protein n=1 Tax=Actinophytocola oryzae TaxID=502181 RepID=A0A4R7VI19_9PSEU|nr:helix-turn-helix transcriptional regulator [Actinophytocola oryzae]TDV49013.1 helix-turn-helix protein [Actinophytocola oryzae]
MGRTNATACYRELGAELRKYRELAGLSGDDVARTTGWHRSKVCRVEKGQVEISLVDAIHYLGACKVFAAEARDLLHLCGEAERQTGYWLGPHGDWLEDSLTSLIYHESTADRSISYEPTVIPGLLQTRRYARVWIERTPGWSREAVEAGIRSREERQQILHRPRKGEFIFYIHEQALRLRVGSHNVMKEQLLRLLFLAALPHITLRVLPASAEVRAVFGNSFRLFEYAEHNPLVYLDHVRTGLFLEDQEFVIAYRRLLPKISSIALDEAESRTFVAALANALDQRSCRSEAGIYELEEEQL